VSATTAVGTDLWFAAITKTVGGAVHHSLGQPDWQVVKRLAYGSIPASIVTTLVLSQMDMDPIKRGLIVNALGLLLIVTAIATLGWGKIQRFALRFNPETAATYTKRQPAFTVGAGVILG